MYTGIVVGSVVATRKDPGLECIPLLLVQKVENGKPAGMIVATDQTGQAGLDDWVYLIGSKEASRVFRGKRVPTDASIVGFIDAYNEKE